ncbi:lamin tail domain-containing protein [Patescibacteria group bacterium]|nr:lamin tail domain-containing protein [Patescibacteria group bacterium]
MFDKKRIGTALIVALAVSAAGFAVQRYQGTAQLFGYLSAPPSSGGVIFAASTTTSVTPNIVPLKCPQAAPSPPTHTVIINEVAWAGIAHSETTREWIELKNAGASSVSLAGWQILNAAESVEIFFSDTDRIDPGGYYLLERGSTDPIGGAAADKGFSGVIKNSDESLQLFDRDCHVIDAVTADSAWPAGTAAPEYRTAERSADLSWHTYSGPGDRGVFGTPGAANSPEIETTQALIETVQAGDVQDLPAVATSSLVMITEVMAGMAQNKSYQFIELYNPAATAADLTGWSIKKKSATGNESPLVAPSRLKGMNIPAGGYFLIAKDGGYTGTPSPAAVWPASYSLAYANNAVVLYDPNGRAIDAVSWDAISPDRSFARAALEGDPFRIVDPTPGARNP